MKIENPQQINQLLPSTVIPRNLLDTLLKEISKPEIQIIFGPRQVGKSTLMYALMKKLFNKKIDLFYFNLDFTDQVFESPEMFISDIKSKKQTTGKTYIFIDEIQRKPDAGLFLKYIYDQKQNFKFIVTGSSSLNIKNMVNEPLTGRKFEHFLHPLSISEILKFRKINISQLTQLTPDVDKIIKNYLIFGGYPEVFLAPTLEDKTNKLKEITKSYITRDLSETFAISSPDELESSAIYLAQNISNILSKENISKTLSLTVYKVEKHLEALTTSFVINLARPFYKNPVKEISHRPKIYFEDNGIRNALVGRLDKNLVSLDTGKLFEQTVFQILKQKYNQVKFWRNINQTEIDFVIEQADKLLVIEAKYSPQKQSLSRSMKSFQNIYQHKNPQMQIISKQNLITLMK